ncbi:MAG: hypothetical protein H3C58_16120 [Fimbriimonadaceae bacterium]|nr:hypothetical protein [Fimbriimonadaceae bacterium]
MSIYANLLSSAMVVSLVFALTSVLGVSGAALAMLLNAIAMVMFWNAALKRHTCGRFANAGASR